MTGLRQRSCRTCSPRCSKLFGYVLNFLRNRSDLDLPLHDERQMALLLREANYFGLAKMVELINAAVEANKAHVRAACV